MSSSGNGNHGYTMIEMLIVLFIIAIVLGSGFLSYRDFNRRQIVISAARQIRSDMRLAQNEALAGKKPGTCDDENRVLNKYNFRRLSAQTYVIEAVCTNPDETIEVRSVNLPEGTSMSAFTTISFKSIGDGTSIANGSNVQIVLQGVGTTHTETITVNPAGDIL